MNTTSVPLIQLAQDMYSAFGRGDIPALIARVSDNVDWHINVDLKAPGANRIPDFRPFHGKEGVKEFFSIVGTMLQFHSFEPVAFLSGGREVAARVKMDLTVLSTKRRTKLESMHSFTFDDSGKLTRFVEYMDTLAAAASWDVIDLKK